MANIVLKTFAAGDDGQGTVTPQDDALIYQNAIPMNGIFSGATVTLSEANVLHVAAGFGIIGGRFFEVNESDVTVELSSSGTLLGRLYIHLELTNADVPISINVATGASLPALTGDPDLNINDGAFDLELATFNISEVTISDIVNTFPTISKANNQLRRATAYSVNDMVFCQSASDSLIFICTAAGTTAVQEPTAYATVTDGNTVTDGTAVFKAVSVSGQITQISKIGNLSNLNTTDKSSTVAAINEVNTKVSKTEVLISNSGDAFDLTKAYAVGDLCIYNNKLYRCITACSAGSWATNQSCFTADTLTNVLDYVDETMRTRTLYDRYNVSLSSEDDLKALLPGNYTYTSSSLQSFMPERWGNLIVFAKDGYKTYLFVSTSGIEIYSRLLNVPNGTWYHEWMPIIRRIDGTYTGTSGSSTISFGARAFRASYYIKCGTAFGVLNVTSATEAVLLLVKSSGITSENITGSNWTFTISGLPWYDNLIATF